MVASGVMSMVVLVSVRTILEVYGFAQVAEANVKEGKAKIPAEPFRLYVKAPGLAI
jgi:hypothetical protein